MKVGDAIGATPPGSKPGDTMMLIHDQIELLLAAIPANGFQNQRDLAAAADDIDALDDFLSSAIRVGVGEPVHIVPTFFESCEISQSDAFSAARFGVAGITPIEHQKSHLLKGVFMKGNSPAN